MAILRNLSDEWTQLSTVPGGVTPGPLTSNEFIQCRSGSMLLTLGGAEPPEDNAQGTWLEVRHVHPVIAAGTRVWVRSVGLVPASLNREALG